MSEEIKLPSDLADLFKIYHDTWKRAKSVVSRIVARSGMLYDAIKLAGYKPSRLCTSGIRSCIEFSLNTCISYADLLGIPTSHVVSELKRLPTIEGVPWELGLVLDTGFGIYILITKASSSYGYETEVEVSKGFYAKKFTCIIRVIETTATGFSIYTSIKPEIPSAQFKSLLSQILIKNNTLNFVLREQVDVDVKEAVLLAVTKFLSEHEEEMKHAFECATNLLSKLQLLGTIYLLY